jgi:hypothetical protein
MRLGWWRRFRRPRRRPRHRSSRRLAARRLRFLPPPETGPGNPSRSNHSARRTNPIKTEHSRSPRRCRPWAIGLSHGIKSPASGPCAARPALAPPQPMRRHLAERDDGAPNHGPSRDRRCPPGSSHCRPGSASSTQCSEEQGPWVSLIRIRPSPRAPLRAPPRSSTLSARTLGPAAGRERGRNNHPAAGIIPHPRV